MSRLDVIAGPNGAGKTTLFDRAIRPDRLGLPFVNADLIAAARWPGDELAHAEDAARQAHESVYALIDARLDFATETVFSHASKNELVAAAADAGYDVILHVVMVPLALSVARVAARAADGGHVVDSTKLPGRYDRLWPLIAAAVVDCHLAVFYDNSSFDGPAEVAAFRHGIADYEPRWPSWAHPAITALRPRRGESRAR